MASFVQKQGFISVSDSRCGYRPDPFRHERIASYALKRQVISELLGIGEERLVFGRRPCPVCGSARLGKPYLEFERGVEFSISHSGDVIVMATSVTPIGLDVEVPDDGNFSDVSDFLMHEIEDYALLACGAAAEEPLRGWLRTEALLKAYGTGMWHGFEVIEAVLAQGWTAYDVPVSCGWQGAIAIRGSHSQPEMTIHEVEPRDSPA